MKAYNGNYFHVIPVKNISIRAQTYNANKIPDEFWEDLGTVSYVSPILRADCVNNFQVFRLVLELFKHLDDNALKYSSLNTPSDFIRRHIITDGTNNITLCNKHLLKSCKKSGKPQVFYTKDQWIKCILKGLFPKMDAPYKEGIPTNTPYWAIDVCSRNTSTVRNRK